MTVYIDSDYCCHVSDGGGMRSFELPFFEGKCPEFIEGYRYVPPGESWARGDGAVFRGEMICPWKDYFRLYVAQLEYELARLKAAG